MKLLKTTALGVLLSLSFTFAHAQLVPAVKEAEPQKFSKSRRTALV